MSPLARTFRLLHNKSQPLILPNAWDAGSARLFEDLRAAAIATTSNPRPDPFALSGHCLPSDLLSDGALLANHHIEHAALATVAALTVPPGIWMMILLRSAAGYPRLRSGLGRRPGRRPLPRLANSKRERPPRGRGLLRHEA
jgi:Phosphoenolpyruvate phosphomutase